MVHLKEVTSSQNHSNRVGKVQFYWGRLFKPRLVQHVFVSLGTHSDKRFQALHEIAIFWIFRMNEHTVGGISSLHQQSNCLRAMRPLAITVGDSFSSLINLKSSGTIVDFTAVRNCEEIWWAQEEVCFKYSKKEGCVCPCLWIFVPEQTEVRVEVFLDGCQWQRRKILNGGGYQGCFINAFAEIGVLFVTDIRTKLKSILEVCFRPTCYGLCNKLKWQVSVFETDPSQILEGSCVCLPPAHIPQRILKPTSDLLGANRREYRENQPREECKCIEFLERRWIRSSSTRTNSLPWCRAPANSELIAELLLSLSVDSSRFKRWGTSLAARDSVNDRRELVTMIDK